MSLYEWQKLVWEKEEIERHLKYGASDTPETERFGTVPLTPEEKDKLNARIMQIHKRMNEFIQERLLEIRLNNKGK